MNKDPENLEDIMPELSPGEKQRLIDNRLCFEAFIEPSSLLQIQPSAEHKGFWFLSLANVDSGEQDYTKRPVLSDAVIVTLKIWGIDISCLKLQTSLEEAVKAAPFVDQ